MTDPALMRLTRLDNGARIITAPMGERSSTSVSFMVNVGSRHEVEAAAGISHFIEHIVFKGGARFPTARLLSEAIESVGGTVNAATDKEATTFWAKVPSVHTALAIDVLADMVLSPRLDEAEVAKERLVVVEELRMYRDSPQDHVHTIFDEVMWPDHALGREVVGNETTVMSFDRAVCAAHLDAHYGPENLVVSVAGAIDHDAVVGQVGPLLSALPRGRSRAAPSTPGLTEAADPVRLLTRRTEQANIVLGVPALSYRDPDRFALDLLNTILGEGMSSRLFLELREDRALAYDVHSYTTKLRDTGVLGIYIGCDPAKSAAALTAALSELGKLASELVSEAELNKAREYSKGRLLVELEGTGALSSFLGQQELLSNKILSVADIMTAFDAVTAADIGRLAVQLRAQTPRVAVIGPFRQASRFVTAVARA